MTPAYTNGLPTLVKLPTGYRQWNNTGLALANLAAWHLQRIGNTGILAAPPEPATTQAIGSIPNPAATQRRVWLDEPPGAVPFDEQGTFQLSSLVAAVDMPVVTFIVPQGFDGVIKWISNNVLNTGAPFVPGSLVWKILINGRQVRNFEFIRNEKGTVFQGRQISPIRIFSGDKVQYTVQGTPPMTGQTVCSFTGYFFPSKGIS